jgi:hypothetical protein
VTDVKQYIRDRVVEVTSAWFNAVCAESGHHLQFQTCHIAVVRDAGGNTLGLVMTNGTEWTVEKDGMSECSPTPTPTPHAETCARSAPITVGDTQGEKCAKCGGSGYAIDTERSGVGRVVGKKCDCGSVAYITNGNPTPHAGGTDA